MAAAADSGLEAPEGVLCRGSGRGVCVTCGMLAELACARCGLAQFCSTDCHLRSEEAHGRVCGCEGYEPVPVPSPVYAQCPENVALRRSADFKLPEHKTGPPSKVLMAQPRFGLLPLQVDAYQAGRMADIFLTSKDALGFFRIGEQSYAGYGSYDLISVPVNTFMQERNTSMIPRESKSIKKEDRRGLWYAMQHCQPLALLAQQVSDKLGCSIDRLRLVHLLRQSSRQCQFTWHNDQEDNNGLGKGMITVVILLRGMHTGMQVWGFQVYEYPGVGACAAFPGMATHRSVYQLEGCTSRPEVVKMTLFYN